MLDVAIIDYNMSNLHSVQAACKKVGLRSKITYDHNEILNARVAILPGVGAFGEAMKQLKKLKLDDCINEFIETGKLFVGICLGLQLLFEKSEEFGAHEGLKIIKGSVKKFNFSNLNELKYPVPHIGWNQIKKSKSSWSETLLTNNNDKEFMYFVHSYYVVPKDQKIILTETTYGNQSFCSAVKKDNIFATQYHPEKSGKTGIKIYEQIKINLEKK